MNTTRYGLKFSGSKLWLIFWAIVWFPIALLMLIMKSRFESKETTYYFEYPGSFGWIAFWLLVCFPITLILLAVNGVTLCKQDHQLAA